MPCFTIGYIATIVAICSADISEHLRGNRCLAYFIWNSPISFIAGISGPSHDIGRHHEPAALFERLALFAHGDRHDHLARVVAGDRLLLAGFLDVEVDVDFLLLSGRLLLLGLALFLLRFLLAFSCASRIRRRISSNVVTS